MRTRHKLFRLGMPGIVMRRLPSSAGGGVTATSRRSSEASFEGTDGGGVVKQFLATPPRLRELRWLRNFFLIAHPPLLLLRRGAVAP